jgi:hypothetical protein
MVEHKAVLVFLQGSKQSFKGNDIFPLGNGTGLLIHAVEDGEEIDDHQMNNEIMKALAKAHNSTSPGERPVIAYTVVAEGHVVREAQPFRRT